MSPPFFYFYSTFLGGYLESTSYASVKTVNASDGDVAFVLASPETPFSVCVAEECLQAGTDVLPPGLVLDPDYGWIGGRATLQYSTKRLTVCMASFDDSLTPYLGNFSANLLEMTEPWTTAQPGGRTGNQTGFVYDVSAFNQSGRVDPLTGLMRGFDLAKLVRNHAELVNATEPRFFMSGITVAIANANAAYAPPFVSSVVVKAFHSVRPGLVDFQYNDSSRRGQYLKGLVLSTIPFWGLAVLCVVFWPSLFCCVQARKATRRLVFGSARDAARRRRQNAKDRKEKSKALKRRVQSAVEFDDQDRDETGRKRGDDDDASSTEDLVYDEDDEVADEHDGFGDAWYGERRSRVRRRRFCECVCWPCRAAWHRKVCPPSSAVDGDADPVERSSTAPTDGRVGRKVSSVWDKEELEERNRLDKERIQRVLLPSTWKKRWTFFCIYLLLILAPITLTIVGVLRAGRSLDTVTAGIEGVAERYGVAHKQSARMLDGFYAFRGNLTVTERACLDKVVVTDALNFTDYVYAPSDDPALDYAAESLYRFAQLTLPRNVRIETQVSVMDRVERARVTLYGFWTAAMVLFLGTVFWSVLLASCTFVWGNDQQVVCKRPALWVGTAVRPCFISCAFISWLLVSLTFVTTAYLSDLCALPSFVVVPPVSNITGLYDPTPSYDNAWESYAFQINTGSQARPHTPPTLFPQVYSQCEFQNTFSIGTPYLAPVLQAHRSHALVRGSGCLTRSAATDAVAALVAESAEALRLMDCTTMADAASTAVDGVCRPWAGLTTYSFLAFFGGTVLGLVLMLSVPLTEWVTPTLYRVRKGELLKQRVLRDREKRLRREKYKIRMLNRRETNKTDFDDDVDVGLLEDPSPVVDDVDVV